MKPQITLLRTLLWSQLALGFMWVSLSVALDGQMPASLLEYNEQLSNQASILDGILGAVFSIMLFVAFIGLLLLRPWAKTAFLVGTLGMLLISFFGPRPIAVPGAAAALYDVAVMANGAILFLLYCTEFGRQWKTVRKQPAGHANA